METANFIIDNWHVIVPTTITIASFLAKVLPSQPAGAAFQAIVKILQFVAMNTEPIKKI
jgi:hypothetical protein